MTGELIPFERHRGARRDQLHDRQPVVLRRAPGAREERVLELRIARIARLLTELEALTRLPKHFPAATLDQARAGLEKARRIVQPWSGAAPDLSGAPQPELDDERIERMYRDLNQYP